MLNRVSYNTKFHPVSINFICRNNCTKYRKIDNFRHGILDLIVKYNFNNSVLMQFIEVYKGDVIVKSDLDGSRAAIVKNPEKFSGDLVKPDQPAFGRLFSMKNCVLRHGHLWYRFMLQALDPKIVCMPGRCFTIRPFLLHLNFCEICSGYQ